MFLIFQLPNCYIQKIDAYIRYAHLRDQFKTSIPIYKSIFLTAWIIKKFIQKREKNFVNIFYAVYAFLSINNL